MNKNTLVLVVLCFLFAFPVSVNTALAAPKTKKMPLACQMLLLDPSWSKMLKVARAKVPTGYELRLPNLPKVWAEKAGKKTTSTIVTAKLWLVKSDGTQKPFPFGKIRATVENHPRKGFIVLDAEFVISSRNANSLPDATVEPEEPVTKKSAPAYYYDSSRRGFNGRETGNIRNGDGPDTMWDGSTPAGSDTGVGFSERFEVRF